MLLNCQRHCSRLIVRSGYRVAPLRTHLHTGPTASMLYVVTGTSRGIGLELVRQLVARGDHVVATARQPNEASELQELAKAHKDAINVVQMDVQDHESIKV